MDGLSAPSPVREGERISLEVSVASSTDTKSTLALYMDGLPLASQEVSLVRGMNKFVQQLSPATRGFHTYSATVEAPQNSDTKLENNKYSAFSLVLGKPNLLIIEGNAGKSAALQAALAPSVEIKVAAPRRDAAGSDGTGGI